METLTSPLNFSDLKTIEILLCDDHEIFRHGIRSTLQGSEAVEIIAEAQNGVQCLEELKIHVPDVVLLDINMPEMDGIECLKQIKALYPFVKVIALTQYNEQRFVKQMMKFGADGYVLKSTTRKELLLALNQVMKNKQYLTDEAEDVRQGLQTDESNKLFPDLSRREREIIKHLSLGKSTKEVAETLFISVHTIDSHRTNIFKKVGVSNVAGLVRWAVNNGLDR